MGRRQRESAGSRALATAGLALALGLSVSACSGGGDPSSSPSDSGSSSSTGSTDGASESPAAYLPVPTGVELTEQGSDLDLGDDAVVAWEPRADQVGVLDVRVDAVQRTTFEQSFTGWDLGDDVEKSTPYFVTVRVTNEGDTDLSGVDVPLYAVDDADTLVEATQFKGTFDPCPDDTFPKAFDAGDKAQMCLVYLAAPGRTLTGVGFRPTQDFDQITWTGKVTRLGKTDDEGTKGGPKGQGGQG